MVNSNLVFEHLVEKIAKVCHTVNKAYCCSLGDYSQPTWEDAPDWQKESARVGVRLHLGVPEANHETSHISWMNQKLEEGWKYGPVKDPVLKEHPCIVPFNQLPKEQQAKDYIFKAIVDAMRPREHD